MKVLLATQKPFAAAAVKGITDILEAAGHQVVKFEKYEAQADLVAAVADAEALIIRSDKVTAEVLDAAPKLKIVVRAGAGFDNVDLAAATAHKVVVMNTPGQNSNAVAELANQTERLGANPPECVPPIPHRSGHCRLCISYIRRTP